MAHSLGRKRILNDLSTPVTRKSARKTSSVSRWTELPGPFVMALLNLPAWNVFGSAKLRLVCKKWRATHDEHLERIRPLNSNCIAFSRIAIKFPNIRCLRLENCDTVTDDAMRALSLMTSLRSLNIACCGHVTSDGVRTLSRVSTLSMLSLSYCNSVADDGIEALADVTALQSLQLAGLNHITDKGLKGVEKLQALNTVNLAYCCNVTDTVVRFLADKPNLRNLNLSGCSQLS
eukprot:CAMPEP_0114304084 /NCGR_PEP_ID=MMETSP0059-20121206/15588_1 /TAXON_ID=36894 /ORGANISM="Pyramimonas parkeae, Strain CCMP726" /LENGTH=232 /DNA_ID=CAMNT_0001427139 /DNA_START=157 /DNA_END=851 /DNA_ORIENTATION=+